MNLFHFKTHFTFSKRFFNKGFYFILLVNILLQKYFILGLYDIFSYSCNPISDINVPFTEGPLSFRPVALAVLCCKSLCWCRMDGKFVLSVDKWRQQVMLRARANRFGVHQIWLFGPEPQEEGNQGFVSKIIKTLRL
jgi:hypothetical protein